LFSLLLLWGKKKIYTTGPTGLNSEPEPQPLGHNAT
jgi:hypothetical protein